MENLQKNGEKAIFIWLYYTIIAYLCQYIEKNQKKWYSHTRLKSPLYSPPLKKEILMKDETNLMALGYFVLGSIAFALVWLLISDDQSSGATILKNVIVCLLGIPAAYIVMSIFWETKKGSKEERIASSLQKYHVVSMVFLLGATVASCVNIWHYLKGNGALEHLATAVTFAVIMVFIERALNERRQQKVESEEDE